MSNRSRRTLALCWLWGCLSLWGACSLDQLSQLAAFMNDEFLIPGVMVQELDGDTVGDVLTDVVTRYRLYTEPPPGDGTQTSWRSLHGNALPLALLLSSNALDVCGSPEPDSNAAIHAVIGMSCLLGPAASGDIVFTQETLSETPTEVIEFTFDYRGVELGNFSVDGTEHIVSTDGDQGADVRTLDLVQDGRQLDYTFRFGFLENGAPAFDYLVDVGGEELQVRLTSPTDVGELVLAQLIGLDGALNCHVRDATWQPGDLVRGVCDNGVTFGLPGSIRP